MGAVFQESRIYIRLSAIFVCEPDDTRSVKQPRNRQASFDRIGARITEACQETRLQSAEIKNFAPRHLPEKRSFRGISLRWGYSDAR